MIFLDKHIHGVRCGIWRVTETMEELLALLPNGEDVWQEAQIRFKHDARRKEWIAVRVLLYAMLGEVRKIVYADSGAPELQDSEAHISISHTTGYVCVALSEQKRMGVDIEQCSDRVERVKSRFVREDEELSTLTQLLVAWSAKEAVYKLLQRSAVDFLEHLRIGNLAEADEGQFVLTYQSEDERMECDVTYRVFDDFVFTLAMYV